MARLHPDLLSGLLSLEPLGPRPGAPGPDPGRAVAFEQYLDQARRAAEQDTTRRTTAQETRPEEDRGDERVWSSPGDNEQRPRSAHREGRASPPADQVPGGSPGKFAALEPGDRRSDGRNDGDAVSAEAVRKPAGKKKEDKHQKREKPEEEPGPSTAAAAGALPVLIAETALPEAAAGKPNVEQRAPVGAVRKGQAREASADPARDAAQRASDAQVRLAPAAEDGGQIGTAGAAKPATRGKNQAANAVETARESLAKAHEAVEAATRKTPVQDTESLPQSAASPRRREGKQAARNPSPGRALDAATSDLAGPGKTAPQQKAAPQEQPPVPAEAKVPAAATTAAVINASANTGEATSTTAQQIDGPPPVGGSPRATAKEPSPASGRQTRPAPGVGQADRVRFVERVARAFQSLGQRGGSIRLRLHPPELGSLRVEVTVRNGNLTARLEAETPEARTALLENLPALRDRLAEHHIKVERFDVDLADRSTGGMPQGPGGDSQPGGQGGRPPRSPNTVRPNEAQRGAEPRAATRPGQGSRLDIFI
jgi:flagellar hook-length control protein FliK